MAGGFDYDSYLMFNPEGKIRQLDYIKRTTDLGNTCLALCNRDAGVLIAHVPRRSKLAEPQEKVFRISDSALFAFSGITNDGLSIVDYLKTSALHEGVIKDRDIHYLEVFDELCMDAARRTLVDSSRLLGASGILLIDSDGVRIVEFDPAGIAREAVGVSIGHRSQSCRTILEDCCDDMAAASADELIKMGIRALSNAHPDPEEETLRVEDVYIYVLEAGRGHRTASAGDYML